MTSSGTYTFSPSNADIVIDAFAMAGVASTQLTQRHMRDARQHFNYMCASWSNQGVNLFAVDLQTIPLIQGTATYSVDASTVMILDAYIDSGSPVISRVVTPISRTEYSAIPNKTTQGISTVFWFDRLSSPTINLWLTPDSTGTYTFKFYRVRRMQDVNLTGGETNEVPYRWLDAIVSGLAFRLATIYNENKAVPLKALADEAYNIAAEQDTENVNLYVAPGFNAYWRP